MQETKIATTQVTFGLFRTKEFELFWLPIDEHTEIVRRVEALFQFANHLEALHQAAYVHLYKVSLATLSKAFRGEPVPQDPNDEPASKLLERIH